MEGTHPPRFRVTLFLTFFELRIDKVLETCSRAEPRFLEPALVSLPEVSAMDLSKTDLATWVKLGMKRRVGEGFVATGTQVRGCGRERKCGHDSRRRGRGVSATCRGGSAECPHQGESRRSCAVQRLCDQTVRSGGEAPVRAARCPIVKEPPMHCVFLAREVA